MKRRILCFLGFHGKSYGTGRFGHNIFGARMAEMACTDCGRYHLMFVDHPFSF